MSTDIFRDRRHAGQVLGQLLTGYARRSDVLVLGLPSGGVPVAYEVAQALYAPMDAFIVRKLGAPGHEELAMGVIAVGVRVLNANVIHMLGVSDDALAEVTRVEQLELDRCDALYRGGHAPPPVKGRTVILVDDGLATGAKMLAAVKALKSQQPARLVVAAPAAAPEVFEQMRREVDEVVCAIAPQAFRSAGQWYGDVTQTSEDDVRAILEEAWRHTPKD